MSASEYRFPFGQPVLPYTRADRDPRDVFVLGAYPSALHVTWAAADGRKRIRALPVDNEPEPFWDGRDQATRITDWKRAVGFGETDGSVGVVGGLNGSSGVSLDTEYLGPLGIERRYSWITDCLPTYFQSDGVAKAIEERFRSANDGAKWPAPNLPPHPTEGEIVRKATEGPRLDELRDEFETANPSRVITLGNAAARVLRAMLETDKGPSKLRSDGYGVPIDLAPRRRAT